MNPEEEKLNPEEELRANNEIEQLKIDLEFGGMSYISEDAPPELIEMFLKNVRAYEENYINAEMQTIFKIIGEPDLPIVSSKDDPTLKATIDRIETLLAEYNFKVLRPTHITDLAWYRFLINDIFPHETTIPLGGMTCVIDYDEFYEDSPTFISIKTREMVESLIDLRYPFDDSLLADECRNQKDLITKLQALDSITQFRERYSTITGIAFSTFEHQYANGAMFQNLGIQWKGINAKTGEMEEYNGEGVCQLNIYNRQWKVEGLYMPGFEF